MLTRNPKPGTHWYGQSDPMKTPYKPYWDPYKTYQTLLEALFNPYAAL